MSSATFQLAKLGIPISILTSVVGGSAWLSSMHNDLQHMQEKIGQMEASRVAEMEKLYIQSKSIVRLETKLDSVLEHLDKIDKRLDRR